MELHELQVRARDGESNSASAGAIRSMLTGFHKKQDVEVIVPLELLAQARETQRLFTIVLGSIAAISLLVGGIGIMNIVLASVTERTREIGIRRALGARKRHIIVQFIVETMVVCGEILKFNPFLYLYLSGLLGSLSADLLALGCVLSYTLARY